MFLRPVCQIATAFPTVLMLMLASGNGWARDDGQVPGSLVDLLDAADQTMTPSHGRGPAGDEAELAERPGVHQIPAPADNDLLDGLQQVIAERNRFIDHHDFFGLIRDRIAAQHAQMEAIRHLSNARGSVGNAKVVLAKARALKNPGQIWEAERDLGGALAAVQAASRAAAVRQRELQGLSERLLPSLRSFLELYAKMRAMIPVSRADPNLLRVTEILAESCQQREDFHEGRILAALSSCVAGDRARALEELARARYFEQKNFWEWPQANDLVLANALVGRPEHVSRWVGWVDDINEKRRTPRRCFLVALTEMVDGNDTSAAAWFARCGRRWNVMVRAAARRAGEPIPDEVMLPEEVAGAWACHLLTCPKESVRDAEKAAMILADTDAAATNWWVCRGRAALAADLATQADAERAAELWTAARNHLAVALERAPGVYEEELLEQGKAYNDLQVWVRRHPAARKAGAASPSVRSPSVEPLSEAGVHNWPVIFQLAQGEAE